jgi:uncharacterized protein (DUF433 family)
MDDARPTPTVNWEDYIDADPDVMMGKPVVVGTRLTAEFVLELLAGGWTHEMLLESYPSLTDDAIRAIYAFAAEVVGEQRFFSVPLPARRKAARAAVSGG